MKSFIFILNVILSLLIKRENLSNACKFENKYSSYLISCSSDESNANINSTSFFNNSLEINLKLKAFKNVKIILNPDFGKMNLRSLDLSDNQDKFEDSVMKQINSFFNLTNLNLSYNRLSTIKIEQFVQLKKLIVLDLSHNEIFYFESNAFLGLDSLIYFNLSKNQLTEIEENDLDNMPYIEEINIDYIFDYII